MVLLLDKKNSIEQDPPLDQKSVCRMIGIRQSFANAILRDRNCNLGTGGGIDRVARSSTADSSGETVSREKRPNHFELYNPLEGCLTS